MYIAITRQIARKLRRQRAFAKLTKRVSGSKDAKNKDITGEKADDNNV